MSEKIKVLITDGMAANGVELLENSGQFDLDIRKSTDAGELAGIIGDYQAIVIRSATTLTSELVDKASSMKLIVRAGAGVDNIDVAKATEKKIPVMNTASANSLAAAEQTIALMFSMLRHIPQSYKSITSGEWDRNSFKGYEATGKTLGLVGLGNIGRIVCEKAIGLGMNVVAFDPFVKSLEQVPSLKKFDESVKIVTNLDDVLAHAQILTLHVPKNKETANLIGAAQIAKMPKGSFLLNCARGGIVDEDAVVAALNEGHLTGAAFDVFAKEPPDRPHALIDHPKAVCVPHLGASTFEAQERVASTAASQMIGFFGSGDRTGVIN